MQDALYARPVPAEAPQPRSSKGEQTRELILATALRLFREQGYEATTMRAVAKEAGVSVGNAYYYFASKEHLIEGFYETLLHQHLETARPRISGERDLAQRLRIVVRTYIEMVMPYHAFAASFLSTAADPRSPLSPFSAESSAVRNAEIAFFAEIVEGSDAKIPKQLRAELPELLWLYLLGVILYWVHDESDGAGRTFELVERTTPLIVKLIGLSRLPGTKSVVADVLDLIHSLRPPG
jgi:AcrR family transcriptional regulator